MRDGPIIIVDDDTDDQDILKEILDELDITNRVISFDNCESAFSFLKQSKESPFFILCDVNMPLQSGLEFKTMIDTDTLLRRRSIPFIFYSTCAAQHIVNDAYMNLTVQGFFSKASGYDNIKTDMKKIVDYWSNCVHPDT